jgi:hypothetical protein
LWQAALLLLFMSWMRTHVGTENSRLLLPGAACTAVLVARGLWSLVPQRVALLSWWRIKAIAHETLPRWGALGLLVLSAHVPVWVLYPAFSTPWLMDARTERLLAPQPLNIRVNNELRLLNAWLGDSVVRPGEPLRVNAIWARLVQATPIQTSYRMLWEAVDQRGEVVARRQFIPWDGRYATRNWVAGEPFLDSALLPIDGNAPRGVASVYLSLIDPAKPTQPVPLGSGPRLKVGEIKIDGPVATLEPGNLNIVFGDALVLRSAQVLESDPPRLLMQFSGRPGSMGRAPDMTYFVHVLDAQDRMLWQQDQPPRINTRWWDAGDVFVETLPIRMPPGTARINLGMYNSDKQRLPAMRDGVPQPDGLVAIFGR